jgi:TPR repeat protein
MEKFDLLVLILDKHSLLLDASQQEFLRLKQQYALDNATLVVVFLGKMANRIISGQQISDIDILPEFDDSGGRQDAALSIQSWVYEAQANMYSGSTVKLRTAIFADVCDDLINTHRISPAEILGNLEETEYFEVNHHTNAYEHAKVSKINKLEALAKNGEEKALYELGLAYLKGDDVEKNEPKAQMLLYKAYLRGNIDAIFALVDLFDEPTEHFRKEAAKHR